MPNNSLLPKLEVIHLINLALHNGNILPIPIDVFPMNQLVSLLPTLAILGYKVVDGRDEGAKDEVLTRDARPRGRRGDDGC